MFNVAEVDNPLSALGSHHLSITSRATPRSLGCSPLVAWLISLPLVGAVGVVPGRRAELGLLPITIVWSVREGRAIAIISSSETVRGSSVSIDHAPGVPGASARHGPPAVIEGLALPPKAWPLHLVTRCRRHHLVLGVEASYSGL